MRRDLDYRDYDPANYGADHPDDPLVRDARERAQRLADQLQGGAQRESGEERARHIEQGFDQMQSDQADRLDDVHKYQQYQLREDFLYEHRRELEVNEQEWLKKHHDPTEQVVYREQMNAQTRSIEERVKGGNSSEYNEHREQLIYQQAAQREHVSNEIGRVQDQTMQELGLDRQMQEKNALEAEQNPIQNEPPTTLDRLAKLQTARAVRGTLTAGRDALAHDDLDLER